MADDLSVESKELDADLDSRLKKTVLNAVEKITPEDMFWPEDVRGDVTVSLGGSRFGEGDRGAYWVYPADQENTYNLVLIDHKQGETSVVLERVSKEHESGAPYVISIRNDTVTIHNEGERDSGSDNAITNTLTKGKKVGAQDAVETVVPAIKDGSFDYQNYHQPVVIKGEVRVVK